MRASKRATGTSRRADHARLAVAICLASFASTVAACGGPEVAPAGPPAPAPPPAVTAATLPDASAEGSIAGAGETADAGAAVDAGGPTACPADMALVDTTYCPKPVLHCLKSEYNKPNHITICHRFAPGQSCPGGMRRQRFCIDRYEYPDREGAHPPVMVSWYDGAAACAAAGKRLCWQSEWESACEGPEKLPFPYGRERDPEKCNIDNPYVKPDLDRVYASRPEVHGPELLKLDQSVQSGERAGCVSGFGVHDLTGNFDEWVNSEEHRGKSQWAALKGGAWGHVRNACRPMTTSHPPEFTYYFISFRCCADAAPDVRPDSSRAAAPGELAEPPLWTPPPMPDHKPPGGAVSPGWTTSVRGPNRPR
jgi:sulfatase modifying factor 1